MARAPKPRGDDVEWLGPNVLRAGHYEHEWIRCAAYAKGHRLARNGEDAVCGRPLLVDADEWERFRQGLISVFDDESDVGEWWVAVDVRNEKSRCSPCKNRDDLTLPSKEAAELHDSAAKGSSSHISEERAPQERALPKNAAERLLRARFLSIVTRVARQLDAEVLSPEEVKARQNHPTLAKLATAVESNRRLKIDWTRIRGFVDWVEQHPEQLEEAIADPPASSIRLQNVILAALAEQLADEHGIERPRWTSAFGGLDEPWSPPATTHIRERYEQDVSEPFRRRNLLLPRSSFSHSA